MRFLVLLPFSFTVEPLRNDHLGDRSSGGSRSSDKGGGGVGAVSKKAPPLDPPLRRKWPSQRERVKVWSVPPPTKKVAVVQRWPV